MRGSFALAAAFAFHASIAQAEPALVDQVERLDIEAGMFDVELQSSFADATNEEERVGVHIVSGEYGLRSNLSAGLELRTEQVDGGQLEAEQLLLQFKYLATSPEESGLGLGAQASIGSSLKGEGGEAELELLAETKNAPLSFAASIAFEAPLDSFSDGSIRYAARVEREAGFGTIALEIGGDLDAAPGEARRQWIGPAVSARANEDFKVEFGYFGRLTEETPDNQWRLQLTFAGG